ncbi:tyrosine-type recombinase/integrase [Desertivirga xinjiangensis]|uniref:tyrosine-type recombinase/integrase n=1 Tax=Desertivirga xinjiangensis TaxID=539206 RepID=UPI00210ECA07|nr:tyrosine-type recombinase/integrase [Pedobacter xinjiangensis]
MPNYKLLKAYDAGGDISKEWFVQYHYLKPEALQRPDEPLYERFKVGSTINCLHTIPERKKQLRIVLKTMKQLLEAGFNPYQAYRAADNVQYQGYNICRCIDKYLSEVEPDLRIGTFRKYKERLGFFKMWLESKSLENLMIFHITKQHIFEFLKSKQLTERWSNKTYNHYLQAIHTFFEHIISNYDDFVNVNPCEKLKRLQITRKGNRPLDNQSFSEVLQHCKENEPYLYQFQRFIYYTCFRPDAELRLLKISDIDLIDRKIAVPANHAKSKIRQYIPIDDSLFEILTEMNLEQYPRHYFLFGKAGRPGELAVYQKYFNKLFRKVKKDLKIDVEITLYAFKHTRVIHMVQDGEKLPNIIKLTRHRTLAELMDYLKDMGVIIGEEVNLKSRRI